MDVYLDDIVVYSHAPEEHVRHVKLVIDTLRKHKFYLSEHKLQFFKDELRILGHVIDKDGIRMDPDKVDKIVNWKTPTNKDLLAGFIGAVGYLTPGCEGIRIPLGHLHKLAAPNNPWRWSFTEQRAFDLVKQLVHQHRELRRKSLDYTPGHLPINLSCDASLSGGSGVLWQGERLKDANIIAFWSGKFNPAQQNYPVHKQELLAIIESLRRFQHLLQGTKFRTFTDHKGLEWIQTQRKLSPRQARWLETLSDFDFEIVHIPGKTNVLADALSRIYSDEPRGTVRSSSEYVSIEEENAPSDLLLNLVTVPLYTGEQIFLGAATRSQSSAREAFPNAKRVILKLPEAPSESLEGGSIEAVSEPETPITQELETDPSPESENSTAEDLLHDHPVTLTDLVILGEPSFDIHECIRNRYDEDKFFSDILKQPKNYKNFEVSSGLVYLQDKGC